MALQGPQGMPEFFHAGPFLYAFVCFNTNTGNHESGYIYIDI